MTREEAINYFKRSFALDDTEDCSYHNEVLEFTIKALEQEPTTKNDLGVDAISRAEMLKYQQYLHGKMSNEENHKLWEFIKELPSVTPQEPILDKIRAEIERITDTMGVSYNQYVSKIDVLQIIDKYRAESEVEE